MFFHARENAKVQSKKCKNYIPFLESTYPEMQRKHIPRLYEVYDVHLNTHYVTPPGIINKVSFADSNSTF